MANNKFHPKINPKSSKIHKRKKLAQSPGSDKSFSEFETDMENPFNLYGTKTSIPRSSSV